MSYLLLGKLVNWKPKRNKNWKSINTIFSQFYPSNINHSRCCDQPICTECFIQIRRPPEAPATPASCPFCVEENFGVLYKPPQWSQVFEVWKKNFLVPFSVVFQTIHLRKFPDIANWILTLISALTETAIVAGWWTFESCTITKWCYTYNFW
jgi:hypothetical protein